jgi:hypothetical protein
MAALCVQQEKAIRGHRNAPYEPAVSRATSPPSQAKYLGLFRSNNGAAWHGRASVSHVPRLVTRFVLVPDRPYSLRTFSSSRPPPQRPSPARPTIITDRPMSPPASARSCKWKVQQGVTARDVSERQMQAPRWLSTRCMHTTLLLFMSVEGVARRRCAGESSSKQRGNVPSTFGGTPGVLPSPWSGRG